MVIIRTPDPMLAYIYMLSVLIPLNLQCLVNTKKGKGAKNKPY